MAEAVNIPEKVTLQEELSGLQRAALRGPTSALQPRFIFIAPERPPMYNQSTFVKPIESEPAIILNRNGVKQAKYTETADNAPDRSEIRMPTDFANDFLPNENIQADRSSQYIKYAPLTPEGGIFVEGMGRQGLNPLTLIGSLLGESNSPQRENRGDRDRGPRGEGLLNGLLTLPEIFLSVT